MKMTTDIDKMKEVKNPAQSQYKDRFFFKIGYLKLCPAKLSLTQ